MTLPLHEDVPVDLFPSSKAGEYGFTCQAGVLTGQLVVLDPVDGADQ